MVRASFLEVFMKYLISFMFLSCSFLHSQNIENDSHNYSSQTTTQSCTIPELAVKKDPPPSWTCPICGQTFEKPVVHKCKEVPSKPKK